MRLFYFRRLHSTFENPPGPSATFWEGSRGSWEAACSFPFLLLGALVLLHRRERAADVGRGTFQVFVSRVQREPAAK